MAPASPSARDEVTVIALAAAPLPARLEAAGILLRVRRVGSIAAIVAPASLAPAADEDGLRKQHDVVLRLAERVDPILPVRFGSRMNLERLEAAIRDSSDTLKEALDRVRGRSQMTARVHGATPIVDIPRTSSSGTGYLERRRELAHALPPQLAPFSEAVRPYVVEERLQPGRGGIRATVFHLVRREDVASYNRAVELVDPRAIAPWRVEISGPWPPFAFGPDLPR